MDLPTKIISGPEDDYNVLSLHATGTRKNLTYTSRCHANMTTLLVDVAKKTMLLVSYSYAAFVGFIFVAQRKLQYFPTTSAPPTVDELPHICRSIMDFDVCTVDGLVLNGWVWDEPKCQILVLHLHGNAGSRYHRLYWAHEVKKRLRCAVALFDYRGFGGNPGVISEDGLIEDAVAAIKWAHVQAGQNDKKLVLHLESIGSVAGLSALAKISTEVKVHGIVVEGGLSSCYDLARSMFPLVPVSLLLRDKWERAMNGARGLQRSIHFMSLHGKADRVVPLWCGMKLFQAVACTRKEFVTFQTGEHNNLFLQPDYFEKLASFYAEVSGKTAHATDDLFARKLDR